MRHNTLRACAASNDDTCNAAPCCYMYIHVTVLFVCCAANLSIACLFPLQMNTFYSTAKWLADVADDAADDTDIVTVLNKDTLLNTDDLPAAIQMLHKEASDLDVRVLDISIIYSIITVLDVYACSCLARCQLCGICAVCVQIIWPLHSIILTSLHSFSSGSCCT
jgi:hypothetical protein